MHLGWMDKWIFYILYTSVLVYVTNTIYVTKYFTSNIIPYLNHRKLPATMFKITAYTFMKVF